MKFLEKKDLLHPTPARNLAIYSISKNDSNSPPAHYSLLHFHSLIFGKVHEFS